MLTIDGFHLLVNAVADEGKSLTAEL